MLTSDDSPSSRTLRVSFSQAHRLPGSPLAPASAPAHPAPRPGLGAHSLAFLHAFPHHTVPVARGRGPKKLVSQAVRTGPASSTFHLTTESAQAQARVWLETSSSGCHTPCRWTRHGVSCRRPGQLLDLLGCLSPTHPFPGGDHTLFYKGHQDTGIPALGLHVDFGGSKWKLLRPTCPRPLGEVTLGTPHGHCPEGLGKSSSSSPPSNTTTLSFSPQKRAP